MTARREKAIGEDIESVSQTPAAQWEELFGKTLTKKWRRMDKMCKASAVAPPY